jgi:hypothetical protein
MPELLDLSFGGYDSRSYQFPFTPDASRYGVRHPATLVPTLPHFLGLGGKTPAQLVVIDSTKESKSRLIASLASPNR